YLMSTVHPNDSVLFVIGQLEVIQNDLYANAVETSYIDVSFLEMNQAIAKSSTSNSYSSKRVRVEDEDPNHVDSDYISDEFDHDKEYIESNDLEESVTNGSKKPGHSCRKANKRELNSSVVHNTKKRSEMLKGINNSTDGGEY
ncbi:10205_t:CDS:2, partial [Dentiscutata heterogama]